MSTKVSKSSSKPKKAGKSPISEKEYDTDLDFEGLSPFSDMVTIDNTLKKELQEQNLSWKFINFKRYKEGGMHKRGYQPYKRKSAPPGAAGLIGNHPDGYTVRGDLVLAVIPVQWKKQIEAKIAKRNQAHTQFTQTKAKEFRESLKETGVKSTVYDTYED